MLKTKIEKLDDACSYFQTGKSLRQCEQLTNIPFKIVDRAAKKRGLVKGSLAHLVINKSIIDAELDTLPAGTQLIIEKESLKRQRRTTFFDDCALKNVTQAMAAPCSNQDDFKLRSETISKSRDAVLGKNPALGLQINNTSVRLEDLLDDL